MGRNMNKIFKILLLFSILLLSLGLVSASDTDLSNDVNANYSLSNGDLNTIDDEIIDNPESMETNDDSINDLGINEEEDLDSNPVDEKNVLSSSEIEITHTGDDLLDIQNAIRSASSGDTILLGDYVYNIGDGQINVTKNITLKGNGNSTVINGSGGGGKDGCDMEIISTVGATIEGIRFNNFAADLTYTDWDTLEGWAIRIDYSSKILVNNCAFINYNRAVNFASSSNNIVQNSYFTGIATRVTGGNGKERGTRAISTQDTSNYNRIINNTFDGPMLDAVNLDSAKGTQVIGNRFINNAYSIYFDKSATDGVLIANNTFIECGHFEANESLINFQSLPVIYARESFSNFTIAENQFIARNGSVLIYCHSTNAIGNVNITSNVVSLAEDGVHNNYNTPEIGEHNTITFMKIPTKESLLGLIGDIKLSSNELIDGMVYLDLTEDIRVFNGSDIVILGPRAETSIAIIAADKIFSDEIVFKFNLTGLVGGSMVPLDKTITVTFNEKTYDVSTVNGIGELKINETLDLGSYNITAAFSGDDVFAASNSTKAIDLVKDPKTSIICANMTTTAIDSVLEGRVGKYFVFTLVDCDGKGLANKSVQIGFLSVIYDLTTDENGQAKLQINLKYANTYTFAMCFLGDDYYKGDFSVVSIIVKKQKPGLTVPNKSYKASAKTKTLTATLKTASGKLLKDKKVTFKVNGKTYTAKTNSKGVASVKVSLTKKKTYSCVVKFAGDSTYSAINKTSKVTIK